MEEQEKEIAAAVAKAKKAERERMAGIEVALGGVDGLEAVREKALTSEMTVEAAKAEGYDALLKATAKQLAARDEQIQALQAEKEQLTKTLGAKGVAIGKLPGFEASDQQTPEPGSEAGDGSESEQAVKDDGKAATYDARVKSLVKEGKSKGRAMTQAEKELPTSQAAWAAEQPKLDTR